MTGGRRGYCTGASVPGAPQWDHGRGRGTEFGRGAGAGFGRGGRGFRNEYYATGLTGWQRAQMVAGVETPAGQTDRVAELEARLDEALARLARLEGTE